MELNISIYVIESGLASLQRSEEEYPRHFVFMLLLSTGIERIMKIILSLQQFQIEGYFLSDKEIRRYSHHLIGLRKAIVSKCFTPEYITNPHAKDDLEFLNSDPLLNRVLDIFSDFAGRDRYIYLDGIHAPRDPKELPEGRWDQVISETSLGAVDIVRCLENLVAILGRILVHGALLEDASVFSPPLDIFMQLVGKSRKYHI
jgi:hypothetical protein